MQKIIPSCKSDRNLVAVSDISDDNMVLYYKGLKSLCVYEKYI